MAIGDRVRYYRQAQGFSVSELAERADVAKSYLSSIERNIQQNPSILFIRKVADALAVTIDDILYDELAISSIDPRYVELLKEGIAAGITVEDLQEFVAFQRWKKSQSAPQ